MDDFNARPVRRRGGPLAGFAVFAVTIVLMIFAAAPAQYYWGMYGLVLTELMLAGIGVAAALLFRFNLREVFAFPKPTGRHIGATLVLWCGYLGIAMACTLMTAYFFPEEIFGLGEQLGDIFSSVPPALMLAVAALMPAICEEVLCRGLLQYTFRGVKARWLVMAVIAVLFGVLHLSVYRFLPTAVLGFGLAYLREKSGGLTLPALLHLVNNTFSTLGSLIASSGVTESAAAVTPENLAILPATAFIYALPVPLLIFWGTGLFLPQKPLGQRQKMTAARRRQFVAALIIMGFLAVGVVLNWQPFANLIAESLPPM